MLLPRLSQAILSVGFRMFPESRRALGEQQAAAQESAPPSAEREAFVKLLKGVHF
jgi:hypothetical protein